MDAQPLPVLADLLDEAAAEGGAAAILPTVNALQWGAVAGLAGHDQSTGDRVPALGGAAQGAAGLGAGAEGPEERRVDGVPRVAAQQHPFPIGELDAGGSLGRRPDSLSLPQLALRGDMVGE